MNYLGENCCGRLAATGIPKSCADQRNNGHTASGLYLIMGTGKVETVFCDFTTTPSDPSKITFIYIFQSYLNYLWVIKSIKCTSTLCFAVFQTWIGYVDVKSSPVYFFFVQRSVNGFNTAGTPIPFDTEGLNVGGAMNLASGIFTAPRDGEFMHFHSPEMHFFLQFYQNIVFLYRCIGTAWLLEEDILMKLAPMEKMNRFRSNGHSV